VCASQKRYNSSTTVVMLRNRMENREATARIKINKLLEAAGWRWIYEPKKENPGNYTRAFLLTPP